MKRTLKLTGSLALRYCLSLSALPWQMIHESFAKCLCSGELPQHRVILYGTLGTFTIPHSMESISEKSEITQGKSVLLACLNP